MGGARRVLHAARPAAPPPCRCSRSAPRVSSPKACSRACRSRSKAMSYGGEVHILGVVDSIFFPGTLAFSRFDYPSALPEGVQERMADIAERLMSGLGFDNGMFNVEMMYDAREDRIAIIEINPRMASQFADLYEKVDGTNSYEVLLDLGCGVRAVAETAARQISLRRELRVADLRGRRGRGTSLRGKTRRDRTRLSGHQDRGPRHVWAETLRRAPGRDELPLRHRQSRRPRPGGRASTIRDVPSQSLASSCCRWRQGAKSPRRRGLQLSRSASKQSA